MPSKVALISVTEYSPEKVKGSVFNSLEASGIAVTPGLRVLVKPNLLTALPLACTHPMIVAAACEWLLDHNAKIIIGDSPAFGSAQAVARAIGLTDSLKPLGLKIQNFESPGKLYLSLPDNAYRPAIAVAKEAIEADLVISMPKIKAHSQLRITLAVKNCYGVICGLRKAIAHARFGQSLDLFCDCVVALWRELPPVAAVADGIIAMSRTGPIKGSPYPLNLIASSAFAPACDAAIMKILNLASSEIPLAQALIRAGIDLEDVTYPLLMPKDFPATDFQTPRRLKEISFNPLYLAKSLIKRLWLERQI